MRRRRRWASLAACAAVAAALPLTVAAQYKCTDTAGKVAFQQTPCTGTARGEKLDLPPTAPADPVGARAAANSVQRELAAVEWKNAVDRAIVGGYPLVGMTAADLDRALGAPNAINLSDYGRGLETQGIYHRGARTWYVYTRTGIVTAIQNTAGGDPAAIARQNCPSRQDLDNEAARLSSITMRSAEREEGRARLAQLRRACL
jgi:hypothetical protein